MNRRHKQDLNYLFNLLSSTLLAGLIEKQTYDVGMQIVRKLVAGRDINGVFTWAELRETPVACRGIVIADRATDLHFYMYGALQQLQERLGLMTHICKVAHEEQVALALVSEGSSPPNFTGEPGTPSLIVMPHTPIFCTLVLDAADGIGNTVGDIWAAIPKTHTLPAWVGAASK